MGALDYIIVIAAAAWFLIALRSIFKNGGGCGCGVCSGCSSTSKCGNCKNMCGGEAKHGSTTKCSNCESMCSVEETRRVRKKGRIFGNGD